MMDQEAALACLGTCQADGQLGGAGSGYGTGGQGRGQGGVPLENASDTAFVNRMSPGKVRQGRVLHQMFVSGVPEKEALTEYSERSSPPVRMRQAPWRGTGFRGNMKA